MKVLNLFALSLLCVGSCLILIQPIKVSVLFLRNLFLHGDLWEQGLTILAAGVILCSIALALEADPDEPLKM